MYSKTVLQSDIIIMLADSNSTNHPTFGWALESFSSIEKERDFKLWELNDNRSVLRGLLFVAMISVALFMITALFFEVGNSNGHWVQLGRFSVLVILVYFYFLITKKITVLNYQWVSFLLFVSIECLEIYSIAIRPRDYITHIGIDLMIIILAYLATNMTVRYQLAVTIPYTIIILLTLFLYKEPRYDVTYFSFIITFVLANGFGYWISVRQGRIRRTGFHHLLNEINARAKIKTLENFLPICGYCKKIQDDDGSWEQIETYISAHSDSQFSHGICPDCMPKALNDNLK